MSLLELVEVTRQEQGVEVVSQISFTQQAFQKIAIAGATGSGKTSLLKMIAGLLQPTTGNIFLQGTRIKGSDEKLLPGHDSIAYLSQHFELRNHYQVSEILAMANKIGEPAAAKIYEICRIGPLLQRWTHQLSGGEKQRIALARLLVGAPLLLLLDEPYSNLDRIHKSQLQKVIEDVGQELQITMMLVSHDALDTLPWADEILILKEGRLHQKANPATIFFRPCSTYAAGLFGSFNSLNPLLIAAFQKYAGNLSAPPGQIVRPSSLKFVSDGEGVQGRVTALKFLGAYYEATVQVMDSSLVVNTAHPPAGFGNPVYLQIDDSGSALF